MANTIPSPNMNMPVPVVGTEDGPQYATDQNQCFSILDAHTHAPGYGVQITPDGISISTDLPFDGNFATEVAGVSFRVQTGNPTTNLSLYTKGNDIYFLDGSGNAVQMTTGGAVNATSSGISSGTASASFIGGVLVATSATSIAAAVDAGAYILRYSGSYPSPSGNYISLQAPAALASGYSITFPALPASNNSFMTMSTAGVIAATVTVDSSSLEISSNTLQIKDSGVSAAKIAAGSITQVKMGALGQQLSTTCGTFSTASTSYVDVTNLSVTITSTGRPIYVGLISDAATVDNSAVIGSGGDTAYIKILRDSTLAAQLSTNGSSSTPATIVQTIDAPGAGTYTYKVQMKRSGGAAVSINYAKLIAYEL